MKSVILERFPASPPAEFATPYAAGFDAAIRGANMRNAHFAWFSTADMSRMWEHGNYDGKERWKALGFAGIPPVSQ